MHRVTTTPQELLASLPQPEVGKWNKNIERAPRAWLCKISCFTRDEGSELQQFPAGIAGLSPGLVVKALPLWQTHLEVLLGYRSLKPAACGIICCPRCCQIPGDQQVFPPRPPPEVTSILRGPKYPHGLRAGGWETSLRTWGGIRGFPGDSRGCRGVGMGSPIPPGFRVGDDWDV